MYFLDSTAKYVFQQGLASCLATNPVLENVYAVGDYSSTIGNLHFIKLYFYFFFYLKYKQKSIIIFISIKIISISIL